MNPSLRAVLLTPVSPAKVFSPSDLGCWLDPADLSLSYQDSYEASPAIGQPLALILDKRYAGARYGASHPDPDFNDPASWTAGTGWEVTGGKLVATAVAANSSTLSSVTTLAAAKTYEATIVCDSISSGTFKVLAEGGASFLGDQTAAGTYRGIVLASAPGSAYVWCGAGPMTASFTSLTVREIPGCHAIQNTADSRPLLQADGKVDYDGVDDSMVITFPSSLGSDCTVIRAVPNGAVSILTGQTIGTTYTDSTDHRGLFIINRALTQRETLIVSRWAARRAG